MSSSWFRAWEREGIEHIPAGERVKPRSEPALAAEAAKPAKAERTVKRSGRANGPRASDGKKACVTTRKATGPERARPAA